MNQLQPVNWVSVSTQPTMIWPSGRNARSDNAQKIWSHYRSPNYPLMDRYQVRNQDFWSEDVASGNGANRSELEDLGNLIPFNTDVWVAYDLFIASGDSNVDVQWAIFGQFHSTPDGTNDKAGSPPFAVDLINGTDLYIYARTVAEQVSTWQPPPTEWPLILGIERDRWYSLVFRVNFDWNTNGTAYLGAWVDGIQVIDSHDPIGYNDLNGLYWKQGIYRYPSADTLDIAINNSVMSFNSLDYRITNRMKLPSASLMNMVLDT